MSAGVADLDRLLSSLFLSSRLCRPNSTAPGPTDTTAPGNQRFTVYLHTPPTWSEPSTLIPATHSTSLARLPHTCPCCRTCALLDWAPRQIIHTVHTTRHGNWVSRGIPSHWCKSSILITQSPLLPCQSASRYRFYYTGGGGW